MNDFIRDYRASRPLLVKLHLQTLIDQLKFLYKSGVRSVEMYNHMKEGKVYLRGSASDKEILLPIDIQPVDRSIPRLGSLDAIPYTFGCIELNAKAFFQDCKLLESEGKWIELTVDVLRQTLTMKQHTSKTIDLKHQVLASSSMAMFRHPYYQQLSSSVLLTLQSMIQPGMHLIIRNSYSADRLLLYSQLHKANITSVNLYIDQDKPLALEYVMKQHPLDPKLSSVIRVWLGRQIKVQRDHLLNNRTTVQTIE